MHLFGFSIQSRIVGLTHQSGGKMIRLFSGPKNSGDISRKETTRGFYDPETTQSNLTVPDLQVLRSKNRKKRM